MTVTRIVNLTPHQVVIVTDGAREATFRAAGPVARVHEVVGPTWTIETNEGMVPVERVQYAATVDDLPDPAVDVLYLVSRVTAAAVSRTDLVFPHGEVRDAAGQIIGCHALGTFHGAPQESHHA